MLVEVCVNSLESAINAEKAGADRLELCSELGVGGITPSQGLIKLVSAQVSVPMHVLVRPRSGHFSYTSSEFDVMKADIDICKSIGVNGVVSGVLNKDGTIDVLRTYELVQFARPLHFTFHRAFDWVSNPLKALRKLEEIGVDSVLTSGKHLTAESGIENLSSWQKATSLNIMAGGGVNPENATKFKKIGLRAVHLSGTLFENEVSVNRKISMNSQRHLTEHHVAVTNEGVIRQVVNAVK